MAEADWSLLQAMTPHPCAGQSQHSWQQVLQTAGATESVPKKLGKDLKVHIMEMTEHVLDVQAEAEATLASSEWFWRGKTHEKMLEEVVRNKMLKEVVRHLATQLDNCPLEKYFSALQKYFTTTTRR